ncbi:MULTISPECIES: HK97 gp10 family phage protein [Clostridium]|uniref:HK97 gp10 family phage protein n=1 Tax=Clostridium TaxID=1485 RepID=UPI0006D77ABC|nr:HK97 gp10 family phage protein [Clostridium massiliamazoniense]
MEVDFNLRELTNFENKLLDLANKKMPNECKKFMRQEGSKLNKKAKAKAKSKVKKKTGNYHKSIKRGKVYKYTGNGGWAIRSYSASPHSHLIEKGHRIVVNGEEKGFVEGKHIFEDTEKEFQSEFYKDTQKFIDETLEKGLN